MLYSNHQHELSFTSKSILILLNFENKFEVMEYGICLLPVIPLRKEPNDRSEMLTQMLFGETARIFDSTQKWISVESDMDKYPGWLDHQQLTRIGIDEYERINSGEFYLTVDPLTSVTDETGGVLLLPAGSCLPALEGKRFSAGERKFILHGDAVRFSRGSVNGILDSARRFINAPYLWGGRTHLGIDCSGLTQAAYRLNGMNIPRDASQQATVGSFVHLLSEAHPGDLAFFDDDQGRIVHVGLLINPHTIIHASGKVRIDTIDHEGIYRAETRNYSHKLRLINRIMG